MSLQIEFINILVRMQQEWVVWMRLSLQLESVKISDVIREKVLEGLEFMGVYFDPDLNNIKGKEVHISFPYSPVKVLVIPTNEEVMIARDTMRVAGL